MGDKMLSLGLIFMIGMWTKLEGFLLASAAGLVMIME